MRFAFFTLVLAICLSCTDGTSEKASAAIIEETPITASTTSSSSIDHPCEVLTGEDIAQTLGWEGSHDATPTTMQEGRLQSCFYTSTNNVGAATITVSQSSERTIERKGLERSFANDLSAIDGRLTYQSLPEEFGDQTIYGYGKRGPSHTYKLRWRKGNHTDYSIDVSAYKKLDKQEVLEMIRVLADKM